MKRCTRCGQEKQEADFYRSQTLLSGRRCECSECSIKLAQKYHNKHKNSKTYRKREAAKREKYKPVTFARNRRYQAMGYNWAYKLKNKYGLTPTDFTNMLAAQDNKCAICQTPLSSPKGKRGWRVDHNHDTKQVRVILCHLCNIMLGSATERVVVLESAITYLRRTPMNNLTIIGRIGKVGELRYTQSGKAVVNFSVAVDNGKDSDGEKRAATWFEISLGEKQAEGLAQY